MTQSLKKTSSKIIFFWKILPAGIYLLKVNNRNSRTRCEICSKLTIKIPERRLNDVFLMLLSENCLSLKTWILKPKGKNIIIKKPQKVFYKNKKFRKIHRKTPVPESLLIIKLQAACNFILRESLAQVFSCKICWIAAKNTFFTKHLRWPLLHNNQKEIFFTVSIFNAPAIIMCSCKLL